MRRTIEDPSSGLIRKQLVMLLEQHVLPAILPEFRTVRLMTLGINNSMLVLSVQARCCGATTKSVHARLGSLFIGYSAAAYFHSNEIKVNS